MNNYSWFSQISFKQRIWLFVTVAGMFAIIVLGILRSPAIESKESISFNIDMSIRDIVPELGVTGKSLARELELPLDVSKNKPVGTLGVTQEELDHAIEHILSHRGTVLKYYVFAALVLWGLVFLVRLGRPDGSDIKNRRDWYPRTPYIISLLLSIIVAGFLFGKSPNPMEGLVKVFKSMVGLYPDPGIKIIAFGFFIILAVIGNKMICGWACPFGALQEIIYSIPILRRIKQKKLPFILTNTIRAGFFLTTLLFLFGVIGASKGFVIYHYINPFNLFNLDFESLSILLTVIIALGGAFIIYRPFCQLICPFGFISWIAENFSIFRIRIDKDKCTQCGACIKVCPLEAAKGRVAGNKLPADCFSCARCLNVCPVDAIQYKSVFRKA
ncbi:4Fe-4S binding protein [candidate division WOR-3 bacterium]|nr:4Fe-4S binding protein [candidate division WOR-3 bacterium]